MSDQKTLDIVSPIAVACDHAGFDIKHDIVAALTDMGFKVLDLGTDSADSTDYPDFGHAMAAAIEGGQASFGVLICGSGIGISIAANRSTAVRCALCHDETTARLAREHNDANVIAFGSRTTDIEMIKAALRTFFTTEFDGGERHVRRRDKLGS